MTNLMPRLGVELQDIQADVKKRTSIIVKLVNHLTILYVVELDWHNNLCKAPELAVHDGVKVAERGDQLGGLDPSTQA